MAEKTPDNKQNKNIHADHRKKVRQRFYTSGLEGMASHNILELLLFFGIPFKDTNPMAHELEERFGSLSAVFEAKREDLLQVKGMTENAACLISMILPLCKKYMEDVSSRRTLHLDDEELIDYIRALFVDNNTTERLYLLCFNGNKVLRSCRMVSEGDIISSSVDFRKITRFALEADTPYVVLAHNHPHGVKLPSPSDVEATTIAYNLLNTLKVKLAEHFIITDDDCFAMSKSPRFAHIFYGISSDKLDYLKDFD